MTVRVTNLLYYQDTEAILTPEEVEVLIYLSVTNLGARSFLQHQVHSMKVVLGHHIQVKIQPFVNCSYENNEVSQEIEKIVNFKPY